MKINELFNKKVKRYAQVGAKSLVEGMSLNGFSINRNNDTTAKTQVIGDNVVEGIDFEFEKKGGIIVFSTDVNAVQLSGNKLSNWINQKLTTIKQRLTADSKLRNIAKKHESVFAFTIGYFTKGQYKAENGKIYSEQSKSMEILGIDSKELIKIAEDICKEFHQESVLVKDYQLNKIFIVK